MPSDSPSRPHSRTVSHAPSAQDNPMRSLLMRLRQRTAAETRDQASTALPPARRASTPTRSPPPSPPVSQQPLQSLPNEQPSSTAPCPAATCFTAVPESGPVLLPYLDRPSELRQLLLSPATSPRNADVVQRIQAFFPPDPDQPPACTEHTSSPFQDLLLAPRHILPDAPWIAAMYALLCPRDPQLWTKFAAIVGADMPRSEWNAALQDIVRDYSGFEPGDREIPPSVLLHAGITLAQTIAAGKSPSCANAPAAQPSPHCDPPPHQPEHKHWLLTLQLPTQTDDGQNYLGSSDTSPGVGVAIDQGLSPGMGGALLLPITEHGDTHPPPAPSSDFSSPYSPRGSTTRRSRAHSRGSSLASPGLDDLREVPEPHEFPADSGTTSDETRDNTERNARSSSRKLRSRARPSPSLGSADEPAPHPSQQHGTRNVTSATARSRLAQAQAAHAQAEQTYRGLPAEPSDEEDFTPSDEEEPSPPPPPEPPLPQTSWQARSARAQLRQWQSEQKRGSEGVPSPRWDLMPSGEESESDPGQDVDSDSDEERDIMSSGEVPPEAELGAAHSDPGETTSAEETDEMTHRPWVTPCPVPSPRNNSISRHLTHSKSLTLALARNRYLPHGAPYRHDSSCPSLPPDL